MWFLRFSKILPLLVSPASSLFTSPDRSYSEQQEVYPAGVLWETTNLAPSYPAGVARMVGYVLTSSQQSSTKGCPWFPGAGACLKHGQRGATLPERASSHNHMCWQQELGPAFVERVSTEGIWAGHQWCLLQSSNGNKTESLNGLNLPTTQQPIKKQLLTLTVLVFQDVKDTENI